MSDQADMSVLDHEVAQLEAEFARIMATFEAGSPDKESAAQLAQLLKQASALLTRQDAAKQRQDAARQLFERDKSQHVEFLKSQYLQALKDKIKPLIERIDREIKLTSSNANSMVLSRLQVNAEKLRIDRATLNQIHEAALAEAAAEFERIMKS